MKDTIIHNITKCKGRVEIRVIAVPAGGDLAVVVLGGEGPHIGTVILSQPRPSRENPGINSATSSLINRAGHKDDEVMRDFSEALAAQNVVLTGGIHLEAISEEEIFMVRELLDKLRQTLVGLLKRAGGSAFVAKG